MKWDVNSKEQYISSLLDDIDESGSTGTAFIAEMSDIGLSDELDKINSFSFNFGDQSREGLEDMSNNHLLLDKTDYHSGNSISRTGKKTIRELDHRPHMTLQDGILFLHNRKIFMIIIIVLNISTTTFP